MSEPERRVLWMIVAYLVIDGAGRWWDWWHAMQKERAVAEFMRLENEAFNADVTRWADTYKRLDNIEYQIGRLRQ